jgi:hypothetical protein
MLEGKTHDGLAIANTAILLQLIEALSQDLALVACCDMGWTT